MPITMRQRREQEDTANALVASRREAALSKPAEKVLKTDCVMIRVPASLLSQLDAEVTKLRADFNQTGLGATAEELRKATAMIKSDGIEAANVYLKNLREKRSKLDGSNRCPTRAALITRLINIGWARYTQSK